MHCLAWVLRTSPTPASVAVRSPLTSSVNCLATVGRTRRQRARGSTPLRCRCGRVALARALCRKGVKLGLDGVCARASRQPVWDRAGDGPPKRCAPTPQASRLNGKPNEPPLHFRFACRGWDGRCPTVRRPSDAGKARPACSQAATPGRSCPGAVYGRRPSIHRETFDALRRAFHGVDVSPEVISVGAGMVHPARHRPSRTTK